MTLSASPSLSGRPIAARSSAAGNRPASIESVIELAFSGRADVNSLAVQDDAAVTENQDLGHAGLDPQPFGNHLHDLLKPVDFLPEDVHQFREPFNLRFRRQRSSHRGADPALHQVAYVFAHL